MAGEAVSSLAPAAPAKELRKTVSDVAKISPLGPQREVFQLQNVPRLNQHTVAPVEAPSDEKDRSLGPKAEQVVESSNGAAGPPSVEPPPKDIANANNQLPASEEPVKIPENVGTMDDFLLLTDNAPAPASAMPQALPSEPEDLPGSVSEKDQPRPPSTSSTSSVEDVRKKWKEREEKERQSLQKADSGGLPVSQSTKARIAALEAKLGGVSATATDVPKAPPAFSPSNVGGTIMQVGESGAERSAAEKELTGQPAGPILASEASAGEVQLPVDVVAPLVEQGPSPADVPEAYSLLASDHVPLEQTRTTDSQADAFFSDSGAMASKSESHLVAQAEADAVPENPRNPLPLAPLPVPPGATEFAETPLVVAPPIPSSANRAGEENIESDASQTITPSLLESSSRNAATHSVPSPILEDSQEVHTNEGQEASPLPLIKLPESNAPDSPSAKGAGWRQSGGESPAGKSPAKKTLLGSLFGRKKGSKVEEPAPKSPSASPKKSTTSAGKGKIKEKAESPEIIQEQVSQTGDAVPDKQHAVAGNEDQSAATVMSASSDERDADNLGQGSPVVPGPSPVPSPAITATSSSAEEPRASDRRADHETQDAPTEADMKLLENWLDSDMYANISVPQAPPPGRSSVELENEFLANLVDDYPDEGDDDEGFGDTDEFERKNPSTVDASRSIEGSSAQQGAWGSENGLQAERKGMEAEYAGQQYLHGSPLGTNTMAAEAADTYSGNESALQDRRWEQAVTRAEGEGPWEGEGGGEQGRWEESADAYAAQEDADELADILQAAEAEHERAQMAEKRRARAKALEDEEAQELMQHFGLDQSTFGPTSLDTAKEEEPPSASNAPELPPPLAEGFESALQTKDGGMLLSMAPGHFAADEGRLVMQVSKPIVLPPGMGSNATEIIQHLAGLGEDLLMEQSQALMPLDDVQGKSMAQIFSEGVMMLNSRPSIEGGSASQAGGVLVPVGGNAETQRAASRSAQALQMVMARGTDKGPDPSGSFVSLDQLGPLAISGIEKLALEGLQIQAGMATEPSPDVISALPVGQIARPGPASTESASIPEEQPYSFEEAGEYGGYVAGQSAVADEADSANLDLMEMAISIDEWEQLDAITMDEWEALDAGLLEADEEAGDDALALVAAGGASSQGTEDWKEETEGRMIPAGTTAAAISERRGAASGSSTALATRASGSGSGAGEVRTEGAMGNTVTLAIMVQLRDPFRNYEPVGAPMMALIQAERVMVPPPVRLGRQMRLTFTSQEDEDAEARRLALVQQEGYFSGPRSQFRLTGVHVMGTSAGSVRPGGVGGGGATMGGGKSDFGFNSGNSNKSRRGLAREEQADSAHSASRWLLASGMSSGGMAGSGKDSGAFPKGKRSTKQAKQPGLKGGVASQEEESSLWSVSAWKPTAVGGSTGSAASAGWAEAAKPQQSAWEAAAQPYRNPDVALPSQMLLKRLT
eukprot:TRINITY_DN8732_c0_g1_i1.p1 TRINITY_DN8732_c0_g1~~TRINITY_DN8732_c0_g1_i1.p1  ORF type:complete len:1510 (-),score=361.59 TRINITY_DN8732_c0_g1_i1:774-5138(-)